MQHQQRREGKMSPFCRQLQPMAHSLPAPACVKPRLHQLTPAPARPGIVTWLELCLGVFTGLGRGESFAMAVPLRVPYARQEQPKQDQPKYSGILSWILRELCYCPCWRSAWTKAPDWLCLLFCILCFFLTLKLAESHPFAVQH